MPDLWPVWYLVIGLPFCFGSIPLILLHADSARTKCFMIFRAPTNEMTQVCTSMLCILTWPYIVLKLFILFIIHIQR